MDSCCKVVVSLFKKFYFCNRINIYEHIITKSYKMLHIIYEKI